MSTDVVERLLSTASRAPEAPAVVEHGREISYGELVAMAWGVARELAAFGDHPRAAILLPQGAEAYAAMFGTLMAGGYYLPCNAASVPAKLNAALDRFRPDVIIEAVTPDHATPRPRPPHRLAYVIFTSGSTGVPKGVMIPRAALNHYVDWALSAMAPGPGDRWSQHPNIGFDLSVLDVYGALCSGAALHPLVSGHDRMLPGRFIAERKLTIWNSVPGVVDMMARAGDLTPARLDSLRLATFCGEPLLPAQVAALWDAQPRLKIHNTYGPTEATVSCTLAVLDRTDLDGGSVRLGDAIPGMALHLLDSPEGRELAISGPQLADGYWNDPERTAQAFRIIATGQGAVRAYVTGDLVRERNGHLFFERRRDTQVKVKGHRLELDEVNSAIRALGHAAAASVLVDGVLHAFVQASSVDAEALRAALAGRLDPHAVPAYIHAVANLPLSVNDKIDLAALAALAAERRD